MDGLPQINRDQPAQGARGEVSTNVLPPPTEVKIRTMKSDLAGLAASGGGMPRFENVAVTGLSIDAKADSVAAGRRNQAVMIAVITVAALIILGVLVYFAYRIVSGG